MPTSNITQYNPLTTISKKEIDARFKALHRFMGYLASQSGGSSYLLYTALLSQTGTDAPVATVLENTLGGTVVWTRDGTGLYSGTLSQAFPLNKTIIPPFGDYLGSNYPQIALGDTIVTVGWYQVYQSGHSIVQVVVSDDAGSPEDLGTLIGTSKILVEVRVYP